MTNNWGVIIYGAKTPRVGGGGHGKVVADILEQAGSTIYCFIDDDPECHKKEFCGYEILGGREKLPELYSAGFRTVVIAIGSNAARKQLSEIIADAGFGFVTAIHPKAVIARSARIGAGTVVAACAVVNPDARIGEHCIINTAAVVEHDNVIGSFVHIAPGACLGGRVSIGDGSNVFTNATVLPDISVGKNCIIGAGAVVLRDVPDGVTVVGNPALVLEKK